MHIAPAALTIACCILPTFQLALTPSLPDSPSQLERRQYGSSGNGNNNNLGAEIASVIAEIEQALSSIFQRPFHVNRPRTKTSATPTPTSTPALTPTPKKSSATPTPTPKISISIPTIPPISLPSSLFPRPTGLSPTVPLPSSSSSSSSVSASPLPYSNGTSSASPPAPTPSSPGSGRIVSVANGMVYSGCFPARSDSWPLTTTNATGMTIEFCTHFCAYSQKYPKYSGVTNGDTCGCAYDSPFTNPRVASDDSKCNINCSGDPSELCGGAVNWMFYQDG